MILRLFRCNSVKRPVSRKASNYATKSYGVGMDFRVTRYNSRDTRWREQCGNLLKKSKSFRRLLFQSDISLLILHQQAFSFIMIRRIMIKRRIRKKFRRLKKSSLFETLVIAIFPMNQSRSCQKTGNFRSTSRQAIGSTCSAPSRKTSAPCGWRASDT